MGLKTILQKLLETDRIPKIHINHVLVKLASTKSSKTSTDNVDGLRKIYGILCETTELVHNFTGVAIMASVVMAVLNNISAGYKVYLLYMGEIVLESVAGMIS